MVERRRLPFLLAALALAGATTATWWLAARGTDPIASSEVATPGAAAAPLMSPSRDTALRIPAAQGQDSGMTRANVSAAPSAERFESFDLDDARWIEGQVVFPPGMPVDESLEILALGFSAAEPDLESLKDGEVRFDEREPEPGRSWSRRTPQPDGRFSMPFAKEARRAQVQLRARYLHVQEPVAFELPCESLTLRPELGGWITGRIVLPREPPAGVDLAGLEGQPLKVFAYGAKHYEREVRVAADLTFEAGGLVASVPHGFALLSEALCAKPLLGVRVQAGQHVDLELVLIHGATVRGQVVDPSGAPIGGASIRAEDETGIVEEIFGESRLDVQSDTDGRFVLRALPPGAWTIVGRADGFLEARSERLELADRQGTDGLELVLERGMSISGRVLWPEGQPAPAAKVSLHIPLDPSGAGALWLDPVIREVAADAKGEFQISGLADANYRLHAVASRDGAGEARLGTCYARQDNVRAGAEVVLQLEPSCSIRGLARDDLGAPVPSFNVITTKRNDFESQRRQSFKDPGGAFEWSGLECDSWRVQVRALGGRGSEERLVQLPNEEWLEFIVPRGANVRGRVVDGQGAPIVAAKIEVHSVAEHASARPGEPELSTGEDGCFEIEGISPEAVIFRASAEGFAPSETQPVDLAPGETREDVLLSLGRGGTLTGEVYDARGKPQPGRTIQLLGRTWGDVSAISDGAGRFQAEHIAPGKYHLMAFPDFAELAMSGEPVTVEDAGPPLMASVEIREGETTHVVLGGPPRAPVRLHGRVTSAGTPVADCEIVAFTDGAAMLSSAKQASTDSSGRYELQLDFPGDYTVIAERAGSTEFHERVPEVAQHELDLELPLGRLQGRVLDATGAPLAEAQVTLEREDQVSIASFFGATVSTDGGGSYAFDDLAPGVYTVRAQDPGGVGRNAMAIRSGVRVPADGAVEGVELRMARPGAVAGRVLSAGQKPLSGATVFLRQEKGPLVSNTTTDKSGRFRFDGLPPEAFTLFARRGLLASEESPPVRIREGGSGEVELVLQPGTILRVSLVDEQGAKLRASLSVTDRLGKEFSRAFTDQDLEEVFTEGFFSTVQRVGPLPPGEYVVRATAPDGRSESSSITLSGQGEQRLELELRDE
jgi:protocatechuate 3,4-dioxygenase beta subunit